MHKKVWLVAALSWTAFVTVLCLVSFSNLPTVKIGNFDKFVHAGFHFGFTFLWYMYLRVEDRSVGNAQILFKIVLASLAFGIGIEIAQSFTKSRSADFMDAIANLSGSVLAALLLFANRNWINKPK